MLNNIVFGQADSLTHKKDTITLKAVTINSKIGQLGGEESGYRVNLITLGTLGRSILAKNALFNTNCYRR